MARDRGQIYEASEAFKDALQIRLEFLPPYSFCEPGGRGAVLWIRNDFCFDPDPTLQLVSAPDPDTDLDPISYAV